MDTVLLDGCDHRGELTAIDGERLLRDEVELALRTQCDGRGTAAVVVADGDAIQLFALEHGGVFGVPPGLGHRAISKGGLGGPGVRAVVRDRDELYVREIRQGLEDVSHVSVISD